MTALLLTFEQYAFVGIDKDSSKRIWSDQSGRGWTNRTFFIKMLLVLLPYCTAHQKKDKDRKRSHIRVHDIIATGNDEYCSTARDQQHFRH